MKQLNRVVCNLQMRLYFETVLNRWNELGEWKYSTCMDVTATMLHTKWKCMLTNIVLSFPLTFILTRLE